MSVQIVEILRRSEQGLTRPFICRGDDDEVWFVKGIGAGRQSQISEWIAGKLGLSLDLPIAPFAIVEVPQELVEAYGGDELSELGSGPAFGSQRHEEVMELTSGVILDIPCGLQQDVLAFDWWIRNGDRLLTENGGNPNLFWDPGSQGLVVIDHNQAFDLDFDEEVFLDSHVFANQQVQIFGDMLKRHQYNEKFSLALNGWAEIRAAIPAEWYFVDPEMTVPTDFDFEIVFQLLKRYEREDFWKTT